MRSVIHLGPNDKLEFTGESLVAWSSHEQSQLHVVPTPAMARELFTALHRDLGVWLSNTAELKA